jgi:hypothetical protein
MVGKTSACCSGVPDLWSCPILRLVWKLKMAFFCNTGFGASRKHGNCIVCVPHLFLRVYIPLLSLVAGHIITILLPS